MEMTISYSFGVIDLRPCTIDSSAPLTNKILDQNISNEKRDMERREKSNFNFEDYKESPHIGGDPGEWENWEIRLIICNYLVLGAFDTVIE